jgi:glycosyltransferase involved in cell wall biosynthesis
MLSCALKPRRVLMTLDAVGGVWRYAIDLARALQKEDVACLLLGLGPRPNAAHRREVRGLAIEWLDQPLDWLARDAGEVATAAASIAIWAQHFDADLIHLNCPYQAVGLPQDRAIVVASHSCLATWWRAVRRGDIPEEWSWQTKLTAEGLSLAHAVIVPTRAHGEALSRAYALVATPHVVPNATQPASRSTSKIEQVLAAGRWWDDGKNAGALDAVAGLIPHPLLAAGPICGPNGERKRFGHAIGVGSRSMAEMRRLMGRSAIFLSPSLYEPFGLAVLEAAAHGCALVLSDIATFRENWADAALFADPCDPRAFAAAIEDLMSNTARRIEMARRAHEQAATFTFARQAEGILAAYDDALSRSRFMSRAA